MLDAIAELGWPLFVKPARGGSSIGTSKAADMAGLHTAIETARRYDPKVLVEAAIDGVEIECSVLEGIAGAPPDTSIPGQLLIDGGEEFWDFEAKYLDQASGMAIPAPIPADRQRGDPAAGRGGVRRGVLRGPGPGGLLLHADGQILINEINTIPGLSPASYFQKMWEASGLPFSPAHRPAAADGPGEAPGPALDRPRRSRLHRRAARPAPPAGRATWPQPSCRR